MAYCAETLKKKENIKVVASIHPIIMLSSFLWMITGIGAQYTIKRYIPADHDAIAYFVPLIQEFIDFSLPSYQMAMSISWLILIIGFIKLVSAIIYGLTTELVVTNMRVMGRRGFIRRTIVDIRHTRFESFEIDDQSILGRILGYGTIMAHGSGGTVFRIHTARKPVIFKDEAMTLIEQP